MNKIIKLKKNAKKSVRQSIPIIESIYMEDAEVKADKDEVKRSVEG
ncbi:hypothetical protein [Bacillus clarus]|nr:hypothetical protein [Bacillus clarus]